MASKNVEMIRAAHESLGLRIHSWKSGLSRSRLSRLPIPAQAPYQSSAVQLLTLFSE
jgi:hypothetical protein